MTEELRLITDSFEAEFADIAGLNRSLPRRTLMNYPIPAFTQSRTGCISEPTTGRPSLELFHRRCALHGPHLRRCILGAVIGF